jgi:hypothetical protein
MSDESTERPAYGRKPAAVPAKLTPATTTPPAAAPFLAPMAGGPVQEGQRTEGLSFAHGLRELANSKVPGLPGGVVVSHVYGPGQTPCDPIAAGLDVNYSPLSAAENRLITLTGTLASGPRPSTYVQAGGTAPPGPVSDHSTVAAPRDLVVEASPGPNSVVAPS